jgi:glutaminyl-peptide cyclotransferase
MFRPEGGSTFKMMRLILFVFAITAAMGCGTPAANNGNRIAANSTSTPAVPEYSYEVVNKFPHDPTAFTQGLTYHNGYLYEGTGGKEGNDHYSWLRKVDLTTGKVLQQHDLSRQYFGEGIAILNDKIYQLTWREGTAFVYNLNDFKPVGEFRYAGEGWGLTHDGTNLYMSDGTHVIRVVEPEGFKTIRTIVVNDERGRPLVDLNELEWVKGEIWANVWQSDSLYRIDPSNGKLLGKIDLKGIAIEARKAGRRAEVLNGIAYDEAGDRIFVTGKFWPTLYEIRVVPKQ